MPTGGTWGTWEFRAEHGRGGGREPVCVFKKKIIKALTWLG